MSLLGTSNTVFSPIEFVDKGFNSVTTCVDKIKIFAVFYKDIMAELLKLSKSFKM